MRLLFYVVAGLFVGLCDVTQSGLAAHPGPSAQELADEEAAPGPVQVSIQAHEYPQHPLNLTPQSQDYPGLFREDIGARGPAAAAEAPRPETWRSRAGRFFSDLGSVFRRPLRALQPRAQRAREWLSRQASRVARRFRRRPPPGASPLLDEEGVTTPEMVGKFYLDALFAAVPPVRKAQSAISQLLRAGTPEDSQEVAELRNELNRRREWLLLLLEEKDDAIRNYPHLRQDIERMATRAEMALAETSSSTD
ncbi:hypothetical protein CSUI_004530 [Cystoisospora suis]|uniref:Transmembrane protein n=1 Tax=Cystoisospora suis TaxID=483139 RepID=A0A2C6L062_9APIC|nr:hypothetical protein CSUI_004530 [Cystoisospora suis]